MQGAQLGVLDGRVCWIDRTSSALFVACTTFRQSGTQEVASVNNRDKAWVSLAVNNRENGDEKTRVRRAVVILLRHQQPGDSAMIEILKRWWEGAYVPPSRILDSDLVFMIGTYERHWSSKAVHAVVEFWMKYLAMVHRCGTGRDWTDLEALGR